MSKTKYTDLLFDVDQTLMDFHRAEHDAMAETLRFFGFPSDDALIEQYSRVNDEHWKMLERGEIDRPTLLWKRFEVFGQRCGLSPMDPHAFQDTYIELLSRKAYLLGNALEVCQALAPHYRMSVITNGNAKVQKRRFDPSPLAPLFAHRFISETVGHDKPSEAFFAAVREAIPDMDPAKTLVIGDSLSSDIAGAVRWGTDSCWLCPDESKRGRAAQMGIQPTYTISHIEQLLDILL